MWDGWADAAAACGLAVRFCIVALVTESGSWGHIRPNVEQRFKVTAVAGFTTGEVKSDGQTIKIGLQMDFGREATA